MKKYNIIITTLISLGAIAHTGNATTLAIDTISHHNQWPSIVGQDEQKKLVCPDNDNDSKGRLGATLVSLKQSNLFKQVCEDLEQEGIPVIREYDAERHIYVVDVLKQDIDNTCGRHTIKNLIYFIHAIQQNNTAGFKNGLGCLYNKDAFELLNEELCCYLHITDRYQDVTFPHKISNLFFNFETFIHENNRVIPVLNINVGDVIPNICPIPMNLDKNNNPVINDFAHRMDENKQLLHFIEKDTSKQLETKAFYKKYLPIASDVFKKVVHDFKNSEQQVLGLVLLLPLQYTYGHWVGVVIRKTEVGSFEFFVLDSANNHQINHGLKNTLDTLLKEFEPSSNT